MPEQALGFQEVETFSISRQLAHESDKLDSLTHRSPSLLSIHLVHISVKCWVDRRAKARSEGL